MSKVWKPLADNKYFHKGTFITVADEGKTIVIGHVRPIIVVSWEDMPMNWRICELVDDAPDGQPVAAREMPQVLIEGVFAQESKP